MSFDPLIHAIEQKNNPTVMGLDPQLSYIPDGIKAKARKEYGDTLEGAGAALLAFNRALIDSSCDLLGAVKIQAAFYEMYGLPGIAAMDATLRYAQEAGLYVILDGKRNDIGSTAEAYAAAYLGETQLFEKKTVPLGADCLTVNAYLGDDGVQPFLKAAKAYDRAIFVLAKTSNPSSAQFQDLDVAPDTPLYLRMGAAIEAWGADNISGSGYSACGAVVGATYPQQLAALRQAMPHTFFLIPGYGAQGGTAKDLAAAFDKNGSGAVVNSSRGLICAWKRGDEDHFAQTTREAVIAMRDDLNSCRKSANT